MHKTPKLKNVKKKFRSYTLIRHKIGITTIEIFSELLLAFPENSPSFVTVTRWISRFNDGNEELVDLQHPGRSITAITSPNI